jgi:ribosomal protein S18 acetylase RimI-like enzyme
MNIQLRPMRADEFEAYRARSSEGYAEDFARTREVTREHARERADREWRDLLPEGLSTDGQFLFVIEDAETGRRAGDLWFGRHPEFSDIAFLNDIVVEADMRGRGVGRAAMLKLEDKASELGFNRVQLHVFGDNEVARSLYGSLGFREISVIMRKEVGGDPTHPSSG